MYILCYYRPSEFFPEEAGCFFYGFNMRTLDIIIPVKNEEANILPLIERINKSLKDAKIKHKMIFIDDHSTDKTVSLLQSFNKKYPVEVHLKKGKPGKAYSIIEGIDYTTSENIGMIDADLQYPPEALPQMFEQLADSGVVIARRKISHGSKLRRFVSRTFSKVFGGFLHNLKVDVQSGLKVFKKEVIEKIDPKKITPWTLDLSLVLIARDLGLGISEVDIEFDKRASGSSKVSIVRTSLEIGKNALKLKFFRKRQFLIKPISKRTMVGAGIALKGKRYITHTTLDDKYLALKTFTNFQKAIMWSIPVVVLLGILINPLTTILTVVAILSSIYFIDVIFNVGVVLKSLHYPPEIKITDEEISKVKDSDLPVYTILCPLYREAEVLPQFLESIAKLNWPKSKLDVILLLEEDDKETVEEISRQKLPWYVRILVTPDSQPKTKPKACNYGLAHAHGEYLVIYDAEDRPDPDQLKKAYLGFKTNKETVVCLQAKLNYFNPHQNLLTRFFTAEYSLWFDVMLPGLQSINTVIPLGGTSNHFRTKTLEDLQGWDPFNVTEDCDLGVRIFKKGWSTAIIDSVTLEEANSNWGNWVRQRSRWLKGYMQTYLVHMRNPFSFIAKNGWHAFIFQLIIGARISFMLINPILWATTVSYFALYAYVGPAIERIFPSIIFYMAVFSLLVGNFTYIYNYMIGAMKRENFSLVKFVFLIPLYWLVASYAATVAAYQLIVKPHYWEKTIHGLHLVKPNIKKVKAQVKEEVVPAVTTNLIGDPWYRKINIILSAPKAFTSSLLFIGLTFGAGILNLGFNVYLGRVISFENLSLVGLIGSISYFANVPLISLGSTVTHKVGFFEGKERADASVGFFKSTTKKALLVSLIVSVAWLISIPLVARYFNTTNFAPFIIFTPFWTVGVAYALGRGFLSGKLQLIQIGIISIFEAVVKFLAVIALIGVGLSKFVYAAIPLSVIPALLFGLLISRKSFTSVKQIEVPRKDKAFPFGFFSVASLSVLAPMAFLSLDVLLANHFLSPIEAGKYALVSVIGKIIFFLGSLISQLILPMVSRNEGANKSSDNLLFLIFFVTFAFTGVGFLFWGVFGSITAPLVFGSKALEIVPFLQPYTFAMVCFTLSQIFVSFYLAKKIYTFPIASFVLAIFQYFLISVSHSGVEAIVFDMFILALLNLIIMSFLHFFSGKVKIFEGNINDFFGLFTRTLPFEEAQEKKLRILIFNWRDIKHTWAGGAENYLHELATLWVKQDYQVTIFCGNDTLNKRYEVIDGVQIVRRGGFYMVYLWAFLYYIFRFRGRYDVVIDSENGIPFFTPLYVRKSKLLLIHHIHQDVFRNHLSWILATVASFLEGRLMPFVYKNQRVVTVSNSSKDEILKLGKDVFGAIEIINPGIHNDKFLRLKKTKQPSFLYLGRLQPYKNIEVAIKAFAEVIKRYPEALLTIAGFGESLKNLKQLTQELKIEKSVHFTGRVSEEAKYKLLSQSWAMIQPSMIEGWGITVIEANASGTPVIASNVNGLRDSVVDGKTGLLIKPKDIKMFSRAMMNLIEDKEFRQYISEQAHKWSLNFSWENSASKFLSVIKDDISSKTMKRLAIRRLQIGA